MPKPYEDIKCKVYSNPKEANKQKKVFIKVGEGAKTMLKVMQIRSDKG